MTWVIRAHNQPFSFFPWGPDSTIKVKAMDKVICVNDALTEDVNFLHMIGAGVKQKDL